MLDTLRPLLPLSIAAHQRRLAWIRDEMPVIITFNVVSPEDQWLRAQIAGTPAEALSLQRVIVQGTHEADRIMAALARVKYHKGLPYGGARAQRWQP